MASELTLDVAHVGLTPFFAPHLLGSFWATKFLDVLESLSLILAYQ